MESTEYINKAIRTESKIDNAVVNVKEFLSILMMFIETAEILDAYKKKIFYNNDKKYNETFYSSLVNFKFHLDNAMRHNSLKDDETLTNINPRLLHGIIGIATESGELIEALTKYITEGELDDVNLQEELGDCRWYDAILHDVLNLSPNETMEKNISKLKVRFPDKYTDEYAEKRNLEAERKELE